MVLEVIEAGCSITDPDWYQEYEGNDTRGAAVGSWSNLVPISSYHLSKVCSEDHR